MEKINYKPIKLYNGQYINEVEPFKSTGIPNKCILHKTITGCGITSCEMKHTKRHSIIVLPNVPVIRGKVNEHNSKCKPNERIIGVYKGKNVEDIEDYLASEATYKKILTTPESFKKVIKAFKGNFRSMLTDYFLLYDECERLITDIDFREQIAAPIDCFFKFHQKALVSATVLPFSDPRFRDFDHYKIEPQFDYSKPLTLIDTNNVLEAVRLRLGELNGQQISFFVNSTETIYALIQGLGIEEESRVFCSQDSVDNLKKKGYFRAQSYLNTDKDETRNVFTETYNFFTSRFFSAVDIKVDYKPDVILVTDVFFVKHTTFDPCTEVIQVAGRYRNGVSTLSHISNFNPNLDVQSEERARGFLRGRFEAYDELVRLYHKTNDEGSKETFKEAYETSPTHRFYSDGRLNSFMVDNYLHDEKVKGYYLRFANLLIAYEQCPKHFIINHTQKLFASGDGDRLKRQGKSGSELNRLIAFEIDRLTSSLDNYVLGGERELGFLRNQFPIIAKGYDLFGLAGLENLGYRDKSILKAITKKEKLESQQSMEAAVYARFESQEFIWDAEDRFVSDGKIREELKGIYDEYQHSEKVAATHITRYYEADDTTVKKVAGYRLKSRRTKGPSDENNQSINPILTKNSVFNG